MFKIKKKQNRVSYMDEIKTRHNYDNINVEKSRDPFLTENFYMNTQYTYVRRSGGLGSR